MTLPDITSESVPSGIFNLRKKRIAFSDQGIEFEKKQFLQTKEMKIPWQEIAHVSYGLYWLTGYYISGGLRFEISLKTSQNKTYRISYLAIYGIGRQKLYQQFNNLLRWLWEFYLNQRADKLYSGFNNGNKIFLHPVEISKNGIRMQNKLVPLNRVELLSYREHFIIQDRTDLQTHHKFSYRSDWDAVLFQPVLQRILSDLQSMAAGDAPSGGAPGLK